MSRKCWDCGTTLEAGICSNCHEELFIQTFQSEDMSEPVSREFAEAANSQVNDIKRRDKIIKQDPEVFERNVRL